MAGRYYSIEFVDSSDGSAFANGRLTTGTAAGDFLISGPGWHGTAPEGAKQLSSPNNRVLVIRRVGWKATPTSQPRTLSPGRSS